MQRTGSLVRFTNLVRVERIASALHDRTIGRADMIDGPAWRAVYLERGTAVLLAEDRGMEPDMVMSGPAVAWLPWRPDDRLRIGAGSVGLQVLAGATPVANAVGHKAESAGLRHFVERRARLILAGRPATATTVEQCISGMLREVEAQSAASATVIEAFLRVLIIEIWRGQGAPGALSAGASPAQGLMERFESLVESQFRERWTIAAYADAVGVSPDRLTDICRRFRDLTPKQIVARRISTEARLLLDNSTHSIEQISALLGFPGASHFNLSFRKSVGTTPGRYRHRTRQADERARRRGSALHEWP
jgi:AraC family transcriptional regulator, transcriptional activator of pobA